MEATQQPAASPTQPPSQPRLASRRDGSQVVLRGGLGFGREANCDVVLSDAARGPEAQLVSRAHAEIVAVDGGFELHDKGSTWGTFVNGMRIGPNGARLAGGDLVSFGSLEGGGEYDVFAYAVVGLPPRDPPPPPPRAPAQPPEPNSDERNYMDRVVQSLAGGVDEVRQARAAGNVDGVARAAGAVIMALREAYTDLQRRNANRGGRGGGQPRGAAGGRGKGRGNGGGGGRGGGRNGGRSGGVHKNKGHRGHRGGGGWGRS
jgi:predicted component of type VI protein secretion system